MPSEEVWTTESSVARQTAFAAVAGSLGLALVIGLRSSEGPGLTTERAGFLLGALLLIVALGVLLAGRQVISVDTDDRKIVVERVSRFGRASTVLSFDDITRVRVGESGDSEGGSVAYHVTLELRSGSEVQIFRGFFEGSHSRPAMEARRERLQRYLSR